MATAIATAPGSAALATAAPLGSARAGEGPLELLDLAIAGVAVAFLLAAALAYHLTPKLAAEEPRPSFLSFCSASWLLPEIRRLPRGGGPDAGPGDPGIPCCPAGLGCPSGPGGPGGASARTTVKDLPWSRGTEDFNPDVFVARLRGEWSPDGDRSLGAAVLRLMLPAWAAVHAIRGPGLLLALLDAYVVSCVAAYVQQPEEVGGDDSQGIALRIALLLVLKELGTDLLYCMSWFVLNNTGVNRVTIPLQVLLLRKVRALRPEHLCATGAADVQQLMQDTRRLDDLLWSSPACASLADILRCALALWQLAGLFGPASVGTGIVTGALLLRLQAICAGRVQQARARERSANRGRLEALKELTDALETLKLYDWSSRYAAPLGDTARSMLSAARQSGGWIAAGDGLGALVGDAFVVIAFSAAAVLSGGLAGAKLGVEAFVLGEVYVQILRESMRSLSDAYSKTMEIGRVTAKLDAFLRLPERETKSAVTETSASAGAGAAGAAVAAGGAPLGSRAPNSAASVVVDLEGASFAWPSGAALSSVAAGGGVDVELGKAVLQRLDLCISRGELVLVSGPVGAGKSSLLLALLGEAPLVEGKVLPLGSSAAYQAQAPRLWSGTLRENVLFGVPEGFADEARLQRAFEASLISVDMDDSKSTLHRLRERTQVGHRGSDVSGGQRARIMLARLVYAALSGVETVLLDDPLAAVDNEVVADAWEAAVLGELSCATRIVVVNSQLLKRLGPDADRILLLQNGSLIFNGTPAELAKEQALLAELGPAYEVCPRRSSASSAAPSPQVAMEVEARQPTVWGPCCNGGERSDGAAVPCSEEPEAGGGGCPGSGGEASRGRTAQLGRSRLAVPSPSPVSSGVSSVGGQGSGAGAEAAASELVDFMRRSPTLAGFLAMGASEGEPAAAAPKASPLSAGLVVEAATAGAPAAPPRLSAEEWGELRRLLLELQRQHPASPGSRLPRAGRRAATSAVASAGRVGRFDSGASSGLMMYVRFFRRMAHWTAAAFVATFLAEATSPYAITFLSDWESGKRSEWGDSRCLAVFVALILGKSALNSTGALLKLLGLAQTSFALRSAIDRTLVALAMPYLWTGGEVADVRAAVTADLGEFEHLASVPLGVAQNVFGLLAMLYARPMALPLVLLAAAAWRLVSFPKTWVFTQVIPMFTKEIYQNPLTIASEEHQSIVPIRALRAESTFDEAAQRMAMHLVYGRFRLWGGLLLKDVLSLPIKAIFVACAIGCVMHVKAEGGDAARALVLYNICWGLVKKINDLNWKLDKAIERLVQYRAVEEFVSTPYSEDASAGKEPPASWPDRGVVSFENVVFRYCPQGPIALNGVTACIRAGEKVGVVGPTGGGKTTFSKLLFRLGPCCAGRVLVDGVDIATLRLSALRRAIGVVPQEPTIFQGTLRVNLLGAGTGSQFPRHKDGSASGANGAGSGGTTTSASLLDAAALAALSACGLDGVLATQGASSLDQDLPSELSVGQKQLLAAARVLIRRPQVLVLDEATASLSQAAADELMAVVRRHCSEATVISIAHRLRFILRCDRVLVLSHGGHVAAFGAPEVLARTEGGYFARQLRREAAEE